MVDAHVENEGKTCLELSYRLGLYFIPAMLHGSNVSRLVELQANGNSHGGMTWERARQKTEYCEFNQPPRSLGKSRRFLSIFFTDHGADSWHTQVMQATHLLQELVTFVCMGFLLFSEGVPIVVCC